MSVSRGGEVSTCRCPASMRCWFKSLVLLALASVAIQYTALRAFSSKPLALLCYVVRAVNGSLRDVVASRPGCSAPNVTSSSTHSRKRTHILILATTRSGSSFVGQLLNQHPEVFYLFEPLYHVQLATLPRAAQSSSLAERRLMLGAARDLLRALYHCQLHSMEAYIRPRPANHSTYKLFRRGASRSLCFPPVCEALQDQFNLVLTDENECVRRCGPLNMSLAADACRAKSHTAIKTVRIPQVKDLRALMEDPKLNLKVIQLVRDPRGILASRIETFRDSYRLWRLWRATGRRPHNLDVGQIHTVCEDFLKSVSTGLARPAWLRGRYILLRYEDLARFPLQKTKELYSFLGLGLDPRVEDWISNNTQGSRDLSSQQKFSTVRDSAANAESWRLKLSLEMVLLTQAACRPLLQLLGYRSIFHPRELRNLSHSLVEKRTFSPL